jgi:signal peptide peptidase SppA
MNNSIVLLFDRIFNRPWLINPASMNTILSILSAHMGKEIPIKGKMLALPSSIGSRPGVSNSAGIAVIPVCGVLTYRDDGFIDWLFGDTTYENIRAQFQEALADPNITTIILDVDSPGGEVSGCFDLVDEIFNARGTKPIFAVINERADSAAYAIASAAEKIFLPRTGHVGSIGAIMEHRDQSKMDEQDGIKYTPIFAGARKNDFDPHLPLSTEAQQVAQDIVNSTYDLFVKTIARNRGISPQAVRETEAALYYGKNAVDIGLADSVAPWTKAISEITKKKIKGGISMDVKEMIEKLRALGKDIPAELMAALAEMGFVPKAQAAQPDRTAIIAEAVTALASGLKIKPELLAGDLSKVDYGPIIAGIKKEATDEVTARVKGILEVCALGGKEKLAIGLISSNATIEDARKKVLEAKQTDSNQHQIQSSVGALGTGEVSPLILDAQKRAKAVEKK